MQAIREQFKEQMGKLGTGELAAEELGKAGRHVAEALHPGVKVAGRALGLDDAGADALATGFVEFLAGLPGQEEGDAMAGLETALAALPGVGLAMKGGKAAGKTGTLDQILSLFKRQSGKPATGGANITSAASPPPGTQAAPSKISTRPDPSGSSTTRKTEPSTFAGPAITLTDVPMSPSGKKIIQLQCFQVVWLVDIIQHRRLVGPNNNPCWWKAPPRSGVYPKCARLCARCAP